MSVTNAALSVKSLPKPGDRFLMQAGNLLIPGLFDGMDDLEDPRETFARALKHWLKFRKMIAAKLADELGTSRATVSRWMHAQVPVDVYVLRDVADVLRVPLWYLTFERPDELPDPDTNRPPVKDEAEQALKVLAHRAGFKIRLEPLKKS